MTDIDRRIERIETDLWYGRGAENPSVVTRLAMLEEVAKSVKWGLRLLVGVFLTGVTTLILEMVKR